MSARWLCYVVGHDLGHEGWWSPGEEYGRVSGYDVDGTGRSHAQVDRQCVRCQRWITVARVHPSTYGWGKPTK